MQTQFLIVELLSQNRLLELPQGLCLSEIHWKYLLKTKKLKNSKQKWNFYTFWKMITLRKLSRISFGFVQSWKTFLILSGQSVGQKKALERLTQFTVDISSCSKYFEGRNNHQISNPVVISSQVWKGPVEKQSRVIVL